MLWFNGAIRSLEVTYKEFQYILCYGSTDLSLHSHLLARNFNTSYVMVQHPRRTAAVT